MRFLEEGEVPTMKMIRESLKQNPPGQGFMDIQLDFAYNVPYFLNHVLDRLKKAEARARRRAIRRKQ